MKTLDSFCKSQIPKRRVSKLTPFADEILELYEKGYQVEQIQEWLVKNKVTVSIDAINRFKRNLSRKNFTLKTPSEAGKKKEQQIEDQATEIKHKATNAFFNNLDKYQKKEK